MSEQTSEPNGLTRKEKRTKYFAEYKASFRGRYVALKGAAKKRGIEVSLTLEQYIELVKPGICSYCRGPLSGTVGYNIDRFDHTKGYTIDNCVPCCGIRDGARSKACNHRKGLLELLGFKSPRSAELLLELLEDEHGPSNTDDCEDE